MAARLAREYKELSKEPWVNFEINDEDLHTLDLALIVTNPDSLYYGGYFKARMTFPKEYPYRPPEFKFLRPIWHPNIYDDGRLCISILHAPGEDVMSGESAGERWSAAQSVESVLISILSLLDDAEVSSPANVDAGVMLRRDLEKYKAKVAEDVKISKQDIPEGFTMPTSAVSKTVIEKVDDDFWVDSDAEDFDEDTFGGSDSDAEMTMDEFDDGQDTGSEEENEDTETESA